MHDEEFSFYDLFVPLTNRKVISFIILIGCVVFFNALFNSFVWDDKTFIQYNPDIQHLDLLYLLRSNMFNNINAGQYRFLVALYFTILHAVFGETTFFYHILQLILHITNTILVFYLFKKFFNRGLSFFLSLLFLIHPMQVESVSFIASTGNPLFTFFGLTALHVSMHSPTSWKKALIIFGSLLLSLFAKETGILFVFLVLLYRILFVKKEIVIYCLYTGVTVGIYAFIRFVIAGVYGSHMTLAPIARLSLIERLLHVPLVVMYYGKTFLFPLHLVVQQYWIMEKVDGEHFYVPLLLEVLLLGIVFATMYVYKNNKKILLPLVFFFLWLSAGFFVYSQVLPLDMTVADRWFYFPLIGILGVIGIFVNVFSAKFQKRQQGIWVAGTVIIVALSIRTMVRNADWRDPITLYAHDSQIEDNFELENNLGAELNMANRPGEALSHFQKSVSFSPHETNLFNLGLAYERQKKLKEAEQSYWGAYTAIGHGQVPMPHIHHEVTYIRLALVVLQHDPKKAREVIMKGISDYPSNAVIWYVRALCEYKLGNHEEALTAAKKAYNLLPNNQSTIILYNQLLHNQPVDTSLK